MKLRSRCIDAPISCFSCHYADCICNDMPSKEEVKFTNGALGVVKRNAGKTNEVMKNDRKCESL